VYQALQATLNAAKTSFWRYVVTDIVFMMISGTTLQSLMIQLMGSECVEIRERALRILLLSFSTLDGKVRLCCVVCKSWVV
jgi:hypothetical protein